MMLNSLRTSHIKSYSTHARPVCRPVWPQHGWSTGTVQLSGLGVRRCPAPVLQPQRRPLDASRTQAFREWFTTLVSSGEPKQAAVDTGRAAARRDFLEARQVSLLQLFDGQEFKFDVPSYQRPYSWEIKQVHEMLQDFLASYRARSEYFLGAIVTVRAGDGPCAPLMIIDGQQRLTSLVILLAYVRAWAKEQQNQVLEERIKRMLYLDPDPLDPQAKGRYRVQLREGDSLFFVKNMVESWLPIPYELSGVAADTHTNRYATTAARAAAANGRLLPASNGSANGSVGGYSSSNGAGSSGGVSGTTSEEGLGAGPRPLENESWWRMYDNAHFMDRTLVDATQEGLNLQEFMFHVLRSCHVVLMTARDEASSFRIFSTLNSRGMDLSMVDKLKADVFEVLDPKSRAHYSSAWSEMEDVLGRTAFHRVFDHMKALAAVVHPEVQHMTVLEYFSRQRQEPALVSATLRCALDYARTLLQLKQCKFEVTDADGVEVVTPAPSRPHRAVSHPLLADDGNGGIVSVWDDGGPDSTVHTYGVVRMLERQARHMSFFTDDTWVAPTLDFFQQYTDLDIRTRFLQAAETLQLYLELCCDAAAAEARWQSVSAAVIRGSGNSQRITSTNNPTATSNNASNCTSKSEEEQQAHLHEIFDSVMLTQEEKADFRTRLNRSELYSLVPRRTLAHLLLRAEGGAVSTSPDIDFGSLQIEKIAPAMPPEGSMWRRYKLGPATTTNSNTNGQAGGSNGSVTASNGSVGGSGSSLASASMDGGETSTSGRGSRGRARSSSYGASSGRSSPAEPSSSGSPNSSTDSTSALTASGANSVSVGAGRRGAAQRRSPGSDVGVKYWFEVQRACWHGKLGNLILLPRTPQATQPGLSDADYDTKAAYYRSCGVESLLPEFSGSVVSGQYATYKFSFAECKARHAALHARLVELFKLAEDCDEHPLDMEEPYWPEPSQYDE